MRKAVSVALALALAIIIGGASKPREFKIGKLLDIGSSERVVEGTAYRSAEFIIQVDDIIYTVRGARIRRFTGDVGQGLIVGDPVKVAIDGGDLIILKPDGKEMKTTIVKRTRAPSQ